MPAALTVAAFLCPFPEPGHPMWTEEEGYVLILSMKAIIPAAGHGTRFAPYTRLVPKELLPIAARPAIDWIVAEAAAAGADEVVIVTSPEKPLIARWFELEKPPVPVTFVLQTEQRGLGHAVLQAAKAAGGTAEPVLILLGDALVTGCAASTEMAKLSQARSGAGVIGLEHVPPEKTNRYGIVRMEGDRIVDMVEKPAPAKAPSDLAVAGRYLLPPAIFERLEHQRAGVGGEIQLTDAIRGLLADHEILGYVYPGHRHDIGNPAGYLKALEAFNGQH